MSPRRVIFPLLVLLCVALPAGCGAAPTTIRMSAPEDYQPEKAAGIAPLNVDGGGEVRESSVGDAADGNGGLPPLPTAAYIPVAGQASGNGETGPVPLIIKQAQIRLQVKNTDQAIDRLTQIVSDTGGYIISNRIWYEQANRESYKYATYTIGVPVLEFENALRRLRALAVKVIDETASGQDVTEEYTDLESRLTNLEATRDRIRSFLAQAKTIEESLRINQELASIEEQIEQVKGRMRFLEGRAAYSTITVQLDPELPTIPTPTPTATPTPTPTPTPDVWDPGETFERASGAAVQAGQFLADMLIYLVVWLPFLIPFAILWIIYKLVTRKRKPDAPKPE